MRISDWSSDVCSSDLGRAGLEAIEPPDDPIRRGQLQRTRGRLLVAENRFDEALALFQHELETADSIVEDAGFYRMWALDGISRSQAATSEEHTPELKSLTRISYAVFRLKNKTKNHSVHDKIHNIQ